MLRGHTPINLLTLLVFVTANPRVPQARDRDADAAARRTPRPVVLKWPSGQFDSLQAAIDAAPDGATIEIKPGTYAIDEPLVVRGKSLTITGAGSGRETDAGGMSRNGRPQITHLQGPIPTDVVDARRAVGLLNYADGGGTLQRLKLSGFDACVLGHESRNAQSLEIRDCAVSDASRGCLWFASSNVVVIDSLFANLSKNAIVLSTPVGGLTAIGIEFSDIVENAILLKSGDQQNHLITEAHITNCGGAGIVVQNSFAIVLDSTFQFCVQGGIWYLGSTGTVKGCSFDQMHIGAVAAVGSEVQILENTILNTLATPDGNLGDAIILMADATKQSDGYVSDNDILNSERAGLSNFGSYAQLEGNSIKCSVFDLAGESFLGFDFTFAPDVGNECGCAVPDGCLLTTVEIAPPAPVVPVE